MIAQCLQCYRPLMNVRSFLPDFHILTAAKSLQSCLTLWDPIDSSPPGSPVPGILQARTLEWVAISSSNAWKWKVKVKSLSRVWLLVTPWTAPYQAPPSMGFSRQEYWSGMPLPSPSIYLRRSHYPLGYHVSKNPRFKEGGGHWTVGGTVATIPLFLPASLHPSILI